ncbi:metallophosphoesterase [Mesosutterella sp. OilRF-GAM-744-9]|uniref:Metallophosphoesterase n=1 Tax=Mesosutterella porci TaxID=2915351 RepID=A0ABS9MRG7_9BURK|nr:metallophosphoesterase [Mesosutterella sp. oilRF-744-WT-GAM-9]MCG5030967.1 metallophosphoesterase [Mesosutterella sp. oilRF-744-WT-GAM-9]
MKRRLFIQSALGALIAPAAGPLFAKTVTSGAIQLPPRTEIVSRFGFVTDIHYCVAPVRRIPSEDSIRVYRDSLVKLRQATDLFNVSDLDFAIELGDFKDCNDDGDREGTLRYLQTVESAFSRFNGPRYHVCGNHDFDKISYQDFLSNVVNHGPANGKSYYSFISGGVKYIVLDACYNNARGEHYSSGNLNWKVAVIPDAERAWLSKELSSGKEPVIVFTHQLLNYWDVNPNLPDDFIIRDAKSVVEMLEKSGRVLAVISGHYHRGYYSARNGIHYVVNQGMVERPLPRNVLGIVSVDKNQNVYVEGIYNERSHVCRRA